MSAENILLAVETSAGPVSCAIVKCKENDLDSMQILSESFASTAQPHSKTLMPMLEGVLKNADLSPKDVTALAVAHGPGSFTGVRIGLSAVKGFAFTKDLPCIGVSTLEAMAQMWHGNGMAGLIVPVMDARCAQIYTAMFESDGRQVVRLSPDEALSQEEMKNRIKKQKNVVYLLGDGAQLCYNIWQKDCPHLRLAPAPLRWQRASGVAAAAVLHWQQAGSGEVLTPFYLRLPQAERELRARQARAGQS